MVDQQQDFAQYDPSLSLTAPSLPAFRARHEFPRAKRCTSDGLNWIDRVVIIAFMLAFVIFLCECMKSHNHIPRSACGAPALRFSRHCSQGLGEENRSLQLFLEHNTIDSEGVDSVLCSVPADDGDSTDSVVDL